LKNLVLLGAFVSSWLFVNNLPLT